ncbi:hypothetical protein K502DRAFT_328412 [Neoconidiobolus thromboides FSU 785]|nr:hypothetical protein K502DRAFT_328412 [Neoconidiobolus thromboides FSU 785]
MGKAKVSEASKRASEWNSLLKWARKERGPYLDINTLTYHYSLEHYKVLEEKENKIKNNQTYLKAMNHQTNIQREYEQFKKEQMDLQAKVIQAQTELGLDLSSDNELNIDKTFWNLSSSKNGKENQTSVTNPNPTGRRGRPRKILD